MVGGCPGLPNPLRSAAGQQLRQPDQRNAGFTGRQQSFFAKRIAHLGSHRGQMRAAPCQGRSFDRTQTRHLGWIAGSHDQADVTAAIGAEQVAVM
jgi:hypothetical protein